MNAALFDQETLDELQELLEDEFVELIETYIRDTESKVSLLDDAIKSDDSDQTRKLAHSVKGASYNLGIQEFGELCHQMETEAAGGNLGSVAKIFTTAQPMSNAVIDALRSKYLS